jgi:hypothetical protein
MKKLKYYTVYVIGECKLDPITKLPVKATKVENPTLPEEVLRNKRIDLSGGYDIAWQRTGRDNAEMRASMNNYDPRFFQTEMVEVNVEADTITTASGKTIRIGAMTTKGKTVNCFATRHREVFKALTQEIASCNFVLVIPPEGGLKPVMPVARIEGYAQPGYEVQFPTGFWYEVYNNDPVTHIEKPVITRSYDRKTGILSESPMKLNSASIFLFPNELDAEEAHVQTAILNFKKHEIVDVKGNERADDVKVTAAQTDATGKQPDVPVI